MIRPFIFGKALARPPRPSGCGSWPRTRTVLRTHAVLALWWSSWPGLVGARGVGEGLGSGLLECF